MLVANSNQIRQADQRMIEHYAFPGILLMERAGTLASNKILELYPEIRKFLILAGPGNNGGDGFVVARHLHNAGKTVQIMLSGPPEKLFGDAKKMFEIVKKMGIPYHIYGPYQKNFLDEYMQAGTIVIDALLGTGVDSELRDPIAGLINEVGQKRNDCVALDMPSGLLGDSGQVISRPLRCAHTITFQLPKLCHYITPASTFCGQIHLVDIGIYPKVLGDIGMEVQLMDSDLVRYWHRPRKDDTHKGDFGHAILAGGSRGKSGAIALTTRAAIEIGAGLCTAFIPGSASCSFSRTTLEGMSIPYGTEKNTHLNETAGELFGTYLEGKSAVAIGPGLEHNPDTVKFVERALEHVKNANLPLVLDADALNILSDKPELWDLLNPGTILTPHPGEMSRLMQADTAKVQNNRLEYARALAKGRNVIVVLKGAGTIVAAPSGEIFLSDRGNPGMASGGSGDVLTGAITGFLSQGYSQIQSAAMAVYVHGTTGDLLSKEFGLEGVVAGKIMRALGKGLHAILNEQSEEEIKLAENVVVRD